MKCPACQHENPDGSKFCNECGTRLEVRCSACGTVNPPGAKFCNECGTKITGEAAPPPTTPKPLESAPPTTRHTPSQEELAGQRRRVAILFADVSGSTALGEKYDAEVVFEVMNECFAGLTAIIQKHDGHVLKYIGDCVMALFGAPVAHGDDPQRAVRAGMEMQVWLSQFSEELQAKRGLPFRMRVGINFGTVVAGGVGAQDRMEYDVLGDAVNVAQRLEAAAEPGAVYVSEALERLARDRVVFEPVGLVQVKGRAQGVQVFRAVREKALDERTLNAVRQLDLVGRDEQVAELSALVGHETGGFLALSGEPGIGKTALLAKTAAMAREVGFQVHVLSGAEREVHAPFAVPRNWLRDVLAAEADFAATLSALHTFGKDVADYAGELALVLHPNAAEAPAGLDAQTRQRLQVLGFVALARALGERGRLLLVVDDLQWLDPASQEVVHALVESCVGGELPGVLLLVAYRAGTPPQWVGEYAEFIRAVPALEKAACLELVRQWVRPEDLPEAVVGEIIGRSGGHPHYLVELMRHLVETEQIRLESGRWVYTSAGEEPLPDTLYGAIAARIDRLEAGQRTAVQCAAPVGQQFPLWIVREIERALPWREVLGELEDLQFMDEVEPEPNAEFRFKQAVVREVAYESLLQGRRRQLHAQIAGLLEARAVPSETASTLAWHLEHAELWGRAAHWHIEAGHWAGEAYANEDAVQHYEKALALSTQLGPLAFRARRGLGGIRARLGDYELAVREYELGLAHPEDAAVEALADMQCQLARCRHELGALDEATRDWRAAFRRLANLESVEAGRVRATILGEWGFGEYRAGRYQRALKLGRWSYRQAEAAGALLERGDAANLQALAHQELGEIETAIRWYEETEAIAVETGDAAALATVQNNLGTLLFAQGRLKEAEAQYLQAQQYWERIGDKAQLATCLLNLGNIALARGHLEAAETALLESERVFNRMGQTYGAAAACAVLGEVYLDSVQDAEPEFGWRQLDRAEPIFQEVATQAGALQAPDLEVYALLGLARVCLGRRAYIGYNGYVPNARLEDEYLEQIDELIRVHKLQNLQGYELRVRGQILRDRGQNAVALTCLKAALEHFESMESLQEVGRTLLALYGFDERGLATLERAAELFEACGAEGDLERVRRRLRVEELV